MIRIALFLALVSPVCAQKVYFSPNGGCTKAAVEAIGAAQRTIHLQAYGFTSEPIAAALVAAKRRGVEVEALLDRSDRTAKRCQAPLLKRAGIPYLFDAKHPIAHAKIIIIDGTTVLAGSFNWTVQAEKNSEDLLVIPNQPLAAQFELNYQAHRVHCEK